MKCFLFVLTVFVLNSQDVLSDKNPSYGYIENIKTYNIRLGGETELNNFTTSFFSVATSFSFKEKKYRISTNSLYFFVAGLFSMNSPHTTNNKTLNTLLAPLWLTNIGYNQKLYKNIFLKFKQRTDFYMLSKDSKVYSESCLGIEFKSSKFKANATVNKSLLNGYYESNKMYIGISLGFSG